MEDTKHKFKDYIVNKQFTKVVKALLSTKKARFKKDIGRAMEVHHHVVGRITRGEGRITLTQIDLLMKKYGVNPSYLFGRASNMFIGEKGDEDNPIEVEKGNIKIVKPKDLLKAVQVSKNIGNKIHEIFTSQKLLKAENRIEAMEAESEANKEVGAKVKALLMSINNGLPSQLIKNGEGYKWLNTKYIENK